MTRPIDIRDLDRINAELTDARLGLDEDGNLIMTNEPDNSPIGTAASRDIGTAPDEIPLNSDLGSASLVDTGTDPGNTPLNSDLGNASLATTGTATGEIPTADDLGVVGETNFTSGNLNPDTFGGADGSLAIKGYAKRVTDALFDLPTNNKTEAVSITNVGTFDVVDVDGNIQAGGGGVVPTLSSASGIGGTVIFVIGITGMTIDETLFLRSIGNSTVKVNV